MTSTVSHPLRNCHPDTRAQNYLDRGWWRPETLLDLLDGHIRTRGDHAALTDPENLPQIADLDPLSLTWRELDTEVDRIAALFYANGVRAGDVVAVLLPNSVALTATYFALWRLGAISSPMPASYRSHELGRIVQSAQATAVVTTVRQHDRSPGEEALRLTESCPTLRTIFTFGTGSTDGAVSLDSTAPCAEELERMREAVRGIERSVNDCVTICWTSGTEAAPKGVPRCHGDWLSIGQAVQDGLLTEPESVILGPFPMVNMAGFATSFLPWLLSGSHLVLHHPLDLAVYLGQIQHHRVTHSSMPPAILTLLLQKPELRSAFDMSSLIKVGSGGAPLPPGVVRDWQHDLGIDVLNFFGSNEGVCLLGAPSDTPDPILRAQHLPNYGAPSRVWAAAVGEQTEVRLVDISSGEEVSEVGQRGELRLKGPTVFAGYLAGTAEKSPFDQDGFLCSGDVFELCGDAGEYLKFVDRTKEIIIRGGMNIAPAEIEGLLIEHPGIDDVAVVGYDDEVLGERCCAVIVPAKEAEVSLEDVVGFLKDNDIASFKLPERLEHRTELPRNPVGKLRRKDLRAEIAGTV